MKKIWEKWNSISLLLRILGGVIIGVALALLLPKLSFIPILGSVFVGALKAIAPVLVFVLVISSIANASGSVGAKFRTVIFFYLISTLLAAVTAVAASFLFPITLKLSEVSAEELSAPHGIGQVLETLLSNAVANPVGALVNANYIGILVWAVLLGLCLKKSSDTTKKTLSDISDAVSAVVKIIISFAPFGILGLVYETVSEHGVAIFADYGKLLLVLVGCMLVIALVIDPLIAWIAMRKNPYPLVFRCLKESGVTAFFTRSSAANIPMNMALCEKLGLDKNMYSVSIPLGATINMDGAAITITVMALAAANTLGVQVDIPTALLLSLLATVSACGASGVAGGSLLLIPLACSLFGIPDSAAMQVVGVGFIISVVQDSFETAINSSGDVLFAATAEFREWRKQGREIKF